ncbi:hypothetical protein ACLEDU_17535 [Lonsdalea quercina]|uniref:hypothetical protein n=1 Tax=Lonsdalea quercina TaxID=71657 RepID=UPI0039766647
MNVNGVSVSATPLRSSETNATGKNSDVSTSNQPVISGETESKLQSTVSTLARQLADAAVRAEARDASSSREELAQKAKTLLSQITGPSYQNNRAKYDAEVPDTDDQALLERSKQATAFVNGSGSNPFKGLTRDQLALIIYDDSGTFTTNERRAASYESDEQEYAWRRSAVMKSETEWNQGGYKQTEFFEMVLEHYDNLPSIESVQYSDEHRARLQNLIEMDFNFVTGEPGNNGNSFIDLRNSLLSSGSYSD